jgi:two-component system KDP operon response regulator KdpE
MTPAILVIEDEAPMRRVLRTALGAQGYHVWEAGTKREAMSAIARRVPQAILLDLGLPDGNGLDLLKAVRERSEVPIVIGANDYVTKPFREAELLARLRAALRSALAYSAPFDERIDVGPLCLRPRERTIYLNGEEVPLTPTEFSLLHVMARQAGRVVTHRHLLREVWGGSYVQDTQYLRVYMRQLRRKLEQNPTSPQLLITTPGVGYRLRAPDD